MRERETEGERDQTTKHENIANTGQYSMAVNTYMCRTHSVTKSRNLALRCIRVF